MADPKRKKSSDRILVKGGNVPSGNRTISSRDDVALLALQLACPQRWDHTEKHIFDRIQDIFQLTAIVVETRLFSSLIIFGADNLHTKTSAIAQSLQKQLQNIIKSAHEKIYFIDYFTINDPVQLEWNFFVQMSDDCFMQETPHGSAYVGYFRLEKVNDQDRFSSRAVESIDDSEVVEQDIYLFFPKNNRYIKILKKGESLKKERRDRLKKGGIKDLFFTNDQESEIQQRRIRHIIFELLEDYALLKSA